MAKGARPGAVTVASQGDRRLTPFSGRVAHAGWRACIPAERYATPLPRRVARPLADLCASPAGPRDRQLLLGASFGLLDQQEGWAFGIAEDGYCGWLRAEALADWLAPTHWLAAPASHLYPAPDMKTRERAALSLGAALTIIGHERGWAQEAGAAWLPACHLRAWDDRPDDPVAIAESLLGTPYLWGGNSRAGLDCSGLVQLACRACNIASPADSDLQADSLGVALPRGAALRRGDLVFWKGHVGWMADDRQLLHANAYHMAVALEPLDQATARIAAAGGGDISAIRRLEFSG